MVVISVYTYGVKIIKKFLWESGFLWGGFHGTPRYALTEVRGYLMQLSVNNILMNFGTGGSPKSSNSGSKYHCYTY